MGQMSSYGRAIARKEVGVFTNEVLFAVAEDKDEALRLLSATGLAKRDRYAGPTTGDGHRADIGFTHPIFKLLPSCLYGHSLQQEPVC